MQRVGQTRKRLFWLYRIGGRTILTANLGAALSIAFFLVVAHWTNEKADKSFHRIAQLVVHELQVKIGFSVQMVRTLKAYSEVPGALDRTSFSAFAASIMEGRQGIQALEWIPRVLHSDREKFERRARLDGVSNFHFTQKDAEGRLVASPRLSEYFPVYFVEPMAGNEAAVGFNLGANRARLEALEMARDSGVMRITERIVLVQDSEKNFGFLLFQPVYDRAVETVGERRQALRGFMLGVFKMSDLVSLIKKDRQGAAENIEVLIFDETAPPGSQLLHPRSNVYATRRDVKLPHCEDQKMPFGGRQWLITVCNNASMSGIPTNSLPWMVLAFGILATFSAASYAELKNVQSHETQELLLTLKESQHSLQNAQRIAGIGNWDWNIRDGSVQWSDEVYRIFGRDALNSPPTNRDIANYIPVREHAAVKRAYRQAVSSRTPFIVDHRIVLSDGSEKSVRERGEIEFGPDGEPVRMQGTVQDFTALRAAEARLRDAQKMEAVGQLTGGAAHEFNNIFSVIIGYMEVLQGQVHDVAASEKMIERSMAAAQRGAELNRQLLSFARQQVLSPQSVNFDAIQKLIEADVKPAFGDDIHLQVVSPKNPWLVRADLSNLRVALVNIASNARDAMLGAGKFLIEFRQIHLPEQSGWTGEGDQMTPPRGSAPEDLVIGDLAPGDYGVILLTDNGCGMSPELASKAFQPFFSTSGEVTGRGLGLSMVQGFAKQSGGDVRIISELGLGTTVLLYLPVAHLVDVAQSASDDGLSYPALNPS